MKTKIIVVVINNYKLLLSISMWKCGKLLNIFLEKTICSLFMDNIKIIHKLLTCKILKVKQLIL